MITKKEFLDKVVEIVYRDNCGYLKAVRTACEELNLTSEQFLQL